MERGSREERLLRTRKRSARLSGFRGCLTTRKSSSTWDSMRGGTGGEKGPVAGKGSGGEGRRRGSYRKTFWIDFLLFWLIFFPFGDFSVCGRGCDWLFLNLSIEIRQKTGQGRPRRNVWSCGVYAGAR